MRRDPFGLRLEPPHPASLCADLAERLRDCARAPDTEAGRAAVAEALAGKWWGLRVLAIRVIGHWGTERDRAWLVERARRPLPPRAEPKTAEGHDLRWRALETREARRVLFRRAPRPEDAEWLLDLWFAEPAWEVWPSWLCTVPEASLRRRIAAEIRRADPERLRRAIRLLALNTAIDNRTEILGHLAAGVDAAAAGLAREQLARLPPARDAVPHRRLRSPPRRRRRPPP